MNNYKIKVNSEAESKEAQELFLGLGYVKENWLWSGYNEYPIELRTRDGGYSDFVLNAGNAIERQEITLPELCDMVVLKRNSIDDATHINTVTDSKVLQQGNKNYYWYSGEWHLYSCGVDIRPIEKPIINPLKEYLVPQGNEKYALTKATRKRVSDWVEVPEGAEFAVLNGDNEINFYTGFGLEKSHFIPESIVWQREQDEPFLTPETTLNDQYAEIEQIRQHSHYKKDVSNLEFVDVYRVLKLFDVTDPCLQHAIKKLLCSGQRGAKSSGQDVQEAIDSLVRFQQMRIEDSLD